MTEKFVKECIFRGVLVILMMMLTIALVLAWGLMSGATMFLAAGYSLFIFLVAGFLLARWADQ